MQTLHYGGTTLRVSDDYARALQAYVVALRFEPYDATWLAVPAYSADSDNEIIAKLYLVQGQPIVIYPSYQSPGLAEPSGSNPAAQELAKWSHEIATRNEQAIRDETSDADDHAVRGN